MKKNRVTVLLMVVLALVLAACPGRSGGESGVQKDELTLISPTGQPASLDPILTNDLASALIIKQVYNTLFDQDPQTMESIPGLAERHQFENDASGQPTRLRLFLKQGAKFHNGQELKASDVKFSLDRAATSTVIRHISGSIETVEVVGDYEVLITLRFPFAPILNNLAHTAMSIVNEKAVTEGGDEYTRNPVGTGPYQFVNWLAGNRIELRRWDDFHGTPAKIRDITIRYITDPATSLLELETGGADILLTALPQDISRIQTDPNLQLFRTLGLTLNYLGLNGSKPPFNDIRVRQAVAHAIDNQALLNAVFQGVGNIGKGPLSSRVWASVAAELPQYDYNPDRARQLLAEAGFPNGFNTTIFASDNAERKDTAEIVRSMLARININADIQMLEWATYLQTLGAGGAPIFVHTWVTITADPDYGLAIYNSRDHGSVNRAFYTNLNVDRLLDSGRRETNVTQRQAIYREAQQLIHADLPLLPLQENEFLIGARSHVRGFIIHPGGLHPLWTIYFE